jgi:hypothetical protein
VPLFACHLGCFLSPWRGYQRLLLKGHFQAKAVAQAAQAERPAVIFPMFGNKPGASAVNLYSI